MANNSSSSKDCYITKSCYGPIFWYFAYFSLFINFLDNVFDSIRVIDLSSKILDIVYTDKDKVVYRISIKGKDKIVSYLKIYLESKNHIFFKKLLRQEDPDIEKISPLYRLILLTEGFFRQRIFHLRKFLAFLRR